MLPETLRPYKKSGLRILEENLQTDFCMVFKQKKEASSSMSLFCGAERARTVDLLRDRQAF